MRSSGHGSEIYKKFAACRANGAVIKSHPLLDLAADGLMAFEPHPVTKEPWPDLAKLFDRPIVRTCFCMNRSRTLRVHAPVVRR